MALSKQPYKGARDFYPEDKRLQKYLFNTMRNVVERFGYEEYDAPILEPLELYKAKTGEEIVNEQTYTFTDRGDRQVAIRPEMTPTVSRMVAAKRQELTYPLRWYSIPNLWRYERPQRGRLREHWQLNVDIFGVAGPEAEHEVISMADSIMTTFGAKHDMYTIRLNSRKLSDYLLQEHLKFDHEQSRSLTKLIDRMHKISASDFSEQVDDLLTDTQRHAKADKALMAVLNATSIAELPPELHDHKSVEELKKLFELLKSSGVTNAVFDPSLMRGFDYYTDIVFEVFDTDPENNRSMFGGGRYDGLVGLFGVDSVPTVGFGLGDVTLQNFLGSHKLLPALRPETDLWVVLIGATYERAQGVLNEMRDAGLNVALDSTGRKTDKQLKAALKKGIKYALFIGEKELEKGEYTLKNLETVKETKQSIDEVIKLVSERA
ncbi:MAG TPA: histidine--tRNA ligase [Patescibacteria group bacterium]|nr:histidine--tRNA ligase [Patescibacteria group bacterium]